MRELITEKLRRKYPENSKKIITWKGNVKEVFYTGRSLIEFSQMHSNPRASSMGYWIMQYGALLEGDYAAVVDWMENGIKLSVDPLYSIVPKL